MFQGQNNDEVTFLSEEGIKQAKAVGEKLSQIQFDKIICSDLTRAKQTLEGILKYQKTANIEYTPIAREINRGDFQGKSLKYFVSEFKVSYSYLHK